MNSVNNSKRRGRGVCLATHPGGTRFGGGDPSEAIVKLRPDGCFDLIIGVVDIGQGSNMAMRTMAAEALGVPLEKVSMNHLDTSAGAYDSGTFASRATFSGGNAVLKACDDAKEQMCKYAAELYSCDESEIEIEQGLIKNKDGSRQMSYGDFAKEIFADGKFVIGHGQYMMFKFRPMDKDGGAFSGSGNFAFGAFVMDIEVDTVTGQIEILECWLAQDVGTMINPMICEGQNQGGLAMSLGIGLMENLYPYYPNADLMTNNLHDYLIPTAKDMPKLTQEFIQASDANGPYGMKGFSEMSVHYVSCALSEAIYDAIGVWIDELPVTPEKVLRALA